MIILFMDIRALFHRETPCDCCIDRLRAGSMFERNNMPQYFVVQRYFFVHLDEQTHDFVDIYGERLRVPFPNDPTKFSNNI